MHIYIYIYIYISTAGIVNRPSASSIPSAVDDMGFSSWHARKRIVCYYIITIWVNIFVIIAITLLHHVMIIMLYYINILYIRTVSRDLIDAATSDRRTRGIGAWHFAGHPSPSTPGCHEWDTAA